MYIGVHVVSCIMCWCIVLMCVCMPMMCDVMLCVHVCGCGWFVMAGNGCIVIVDVHVVLSCNMWWH